ncbi:MAG: hypothetical protein ACU0BF_01830 [Paracoccaceae bacterium]
MLTHERRTEQLGSERFSYALATGAVIHAGGMVMLDAGLAKPASAIATAVCVGVARETARQASGDQRVEVDAGTFRFANATGADEVVPADIGADCYVIDDETVGRTDGSSSRPRAGRIRQIEGGDVWVTIG